MPVGADHAALAVDRQSSENGSLLNLTRGLIATRAAHPALREGAMAVVAADDALLVFTRTVAGQRLTCAFNLGKTPLAWHPETTDRFRVIAAVNGATPGDLPAYSGLVLEQLD